MQHRLRGTGQQRKGYWRFRSCNQTLSTSFANMPQMSAAILPKAKGPAVKPGLSIHVRVTAATGKSEPLLADLDNRTAVERLTNTVAGRHGRFAFTNGTN